MGIRRVVWQEFTKKGQLITKRKDFKDSASAVKFIEKLMAKDGFYTVLATS